MRRIASIFSLTLSLALPLLLGSSGCYYGHLAVGQTRLLMARQSVDTLLEDPTTETSLRQKLELVRDVRGFAADLGLEVGSQYTSYVDWPGDRIVTTVVATAPGEIEATPFRFPIVGAVPYKGFFAVERAEREAERLRAKGMQVCLSPVRAYSTLGWFADPLTTPMLDTGDARLVETVLHELVHATLFLESQPDFNEGLASFVGEEAMVRYYAALAPGSNEISMARARQVVEEDRIVSAQLMTLRKGVEALYGEPLDVAGRDLRRERLEEEARAELAALPLTTRDPETLATKARLTDPCLALVGTYVEDTPRFTRVLDQFDGDLAKFVVRMRAVANEPDPRGALFATSTD